MQKGKIQLDTDVKSIYVFNLIFSTLISNIKSCIKYQILYKYSFIIKYTRQPTEIEKYLDFKYYVSTFIHTIFVVVAKNVYDLYF